jgi:hypothetical protein
VAWNVEVTDKFVRWWDSLSNEEHKSVAPVVDLLEEFGPALRRPHVGHVTTSRHANMKELVTQHAGRPYRVLFAFDPRRTALLLIGGDKTGNDRWYEEFVPIADRLFDEHLAAIDE